MLQSDSSQYKPPSPKKRCKPSVYCKISHSQTALNLLHRNFENLYKNFSSPVHTNSNEHKTLTLPASIYESYDILVTSQRKPNFQSLHLDNSQPNKRKNSGGLSFSKDFFENDPDYQKISVYIVLVLNTFLVSATPQ